jgi:hypothetical protein
MLRIECNLIVMKYLLKSKKIIQKIFEILNVFYLFYLFTGVYFSDKLWDGGTDSGGNLFPILTSVHCDIFITTVVITTVSLQYFLPVLH